jgi:hypothetical protein
VSVLAFHWCSAYIRRLCFVVLLFPTSARLVQELVINNNIFAVQKKRRVK